MKTSESAGNTTSVRLTSSSGDSPAKTSAMPDAGPDSPVSGRVFGGRCTGSLANFDPDSSSWRTSQLCLGGEWETYSEAWPRSGMTRSGIAYRLAPSAPLTAAIGSGLLATPTATANQFAPSMMKHPSCRRMFPTPRASDADRGGRGELLHWTKAGTPRGRIPTPDANCWKGGNRRGQLTDPTYGITPDGGQLNPPWVEWLMGYPAGWTDSGDSATP